VTVTEHRELVAALLALDGVTQAAVEPDESAGPGTLRLQLDPGADEVLVAGAVNRLLRARFGLAVDADRVRVLDEPVEPAAPDEPAEPAEPADPAAPTMNHGTSTTPKPPPPAAPHEQPPLPTVQVARPGRLAIQRVQMVSAGMGVSATVTLALEGRTFIGTCDGAATTTSTYRSVAAATLRAIESVVADRARFDVEHVEVAATGPERTVLTVVSLLTDRGSERLSGASVVRDDVRQAVIRAVLAAVNRRLEPLLDTP